MSWTQTVVPVAVGAVMLGTTVIAAAWYRGGRSDIAALEAGRGRAWHDDTYRCARACGLDEALSRRGGWR